MFIHHSIWISLIFIFPLVLSACGPASRPEAVRAAPVPTATQAPAVQSSSAPAPTAAPADAQLEYTSQDFGFSLSYPTGYAAQRTSAAWFSFAASQAPQDTPAERGAAWLEVELAPDQDARWFADQVLQSNAIYKGPPIASKMSVVGGQPAYILEPIAEQDLTRQVYIVYQGFLYHLTFVPNDPNYGAAYHQMEILYAAVMNSLRFLPERRAVPPVNSEFNLVHQIERACEARSEADILRLMGDTFTLGVWEPDAPERVLSPAFGRNEAARRLLDEHLSQSPDLVPQITADWTSLLGDPLFFSPFFPDENISRVFVKGWGPQGSDDALLIITHRMDGSLFWRGIYIAQGAWTR